MANRALIRRSVVRIFVAALIAGVGVARSARAEDLQLAEMDHATWTARDGAPQGVRALAQGADGFLWVGSDSGLYSFDGRTFTPFQPRTGDPEMPAGAIETLLVARDGTIWAGFSAGGIARIQQGRVTHYSQADGKPVVRVDHLGQSFKGDVWALADQQRLLKLGADGDWHAQPTPLGDAGGRVYSFFIDSSDTLWLAQGGRLYRRPHDQAQYVPTEAEAEWVFGFAETRDHSLWVSDTITRGPTGRTQHVDPLGRLLATLPDTDNVSGELYMPDGSLVVSPYGLGLLRLSVATLAAPTPAGEPLVRERYAQTNGLSSDAAKALLLDLDSNLWVGGQRGLDRFRLPRLAPMLTTFTPTEAALCAGEDGEVWVMTNGKESNSIGPRVMGRHGST